MTELFERYNRACDFTQEVKPEQVEKCLKEFFHGFGVEIRVQEIGDFKAARAAWDARDASWENSILIGIDETKDSKLLHQWLPYFEAFEAGMWMSFHLNEKILWLPIPQLFRNERNRCHADGKPALILPNEQWYFLNGVNMEEWMVMTPAEKLESTKVFGVTNAEQRRELIRKVGVERLLSFLPHRVLDKPNDMYQLLSIRFSDNLTDARVLKMRNPSIGVWHLERVEDGIDTVEKALNWRNGDCLTTEVLT